ncbi:hypothetical protein JG537_04560 [Streptococcus sp. SL1232]|uniref:HEPN domain-containing protein n=1 Tax=Streptococcus vicugnae TaxID=2740579 RepID=UPI0018F5CB65|nr:HEPN domain-containing protein [Streptococcus vicugnae]MBJ7540990.1 hypothetical protein [Streptococcus vicugnae]
MERQMYTGNVIYKDIEFVFLFDGKILQLIPPKDKFMALFMDFFTEKDSLTGLRCSKSAPLFVQDDILIGKCNESNYQTIIFLPRKGSIFSENENKFEIEINAFILCRKSDETISCMEFSCQELDYIHPMHRVYTISHETSDKDIILKAQKNNPRKIKNRVFNLEGREIGLYFGIATKISEKQNNSSIVFNSTMRFEFEPTNDYIFILHLYEIARQFIQFLCYRRNIVFNGVNLVSNKVKIGIMYESSEVICESTPEKRGYISANLIEEHAVDILNCIAEDRLFLRHIPKNYEESTVVDVASFLSVMTAFEWEFKKKYPNIDDQKSQKATVAENAVEEEIVKLIESSTGREKAIYKKLRKSIRSFTPLNQKIQLIFKDYQDEIELFGKKLYLRNNEEFNINNISSRLAEQRNDFAHGNLDKEFNSTTIIDIILMEFIIYIMQLSYCGVESVNIKKAINDLFLQKIIF